VYDKKSKGSIKGDFDNCLQDIEGSYVKNVSILQRPC